MITEKQLRDIMSADIELPRSASGRLEQVYEQIRRDRQRKEMTMNNKRSRSDRRFWVVVAAAAAMVLCAGSALAYTLTHYDFVNAVWRTGDTEQQLTVVEDYILTSGQTIELEGYTFTVEEYMLDENGMGFVRYSVENPDGMPTMYDATNGGEYTGGDSEFWFAPDANGMTITGASYETTTADGDTANVHTYVDGVLSTDTKLYFTDVITFTGELTDTVLMGIRIFDENWEETAGTIELSAENLMPSVEYGDSTGGMRARLSPFGVMAYGPDYSGTYDLDRLVITCTDGEYIVIDDEQDILARRTATIGLDGDIRVIFDRMVDMGSVESIDINGYVLTAELAQNAAFAPEASPVAEIESREPDDRSALELAASPAENPFHYRRADGIEVFVIDNDTITAASDEDIHDYFAFTHGYVSYDDFLANAREDFDEYYSSKDHFARSYTASVPDGCMTSQQAIDMYLGILEEYFPEERAKVEYVVAEACRSTTEEYGTVYAWTLSANVDTMWEAEIDAESRVLISPWIAGLNGEFDQQTNEWVSWN